MSDSEPGPDTPRQWICIEATFQFPDAERSAVGRWQLQHVSPNYAYDLAVGTLVPLDATLWSVNMWTGRLEDRPECGYEPGLREEE